MKDSGVQQTKHVYMALINGYAASGQFEKAKQVNNEYIQYYKSFMALIFPVFHAKSFVRYMDS